jgi:hypothetical protein
MPEVDDTHSAWGFLVVLVLVALAAPTLAVAYDGADDRFVDDEPYEVPQDGVVELAQPATANTTGGDVTVVASINGIEETLREGPDYVWNASAGQVEIDLNEAPVSSGDQVYVTYRFEVARAAETEAAYTLVATVLSMQTLYVLVAALNALRGYIAAFSKPWGLR